MEIFDKQIGNRRADASVRDALRLVSLSRARRPSFSLISKEVLRTYIS